MKVVRGVKNIRTVVSTAVNVSNVFFFFHSNREFSVICFCLCSIVNKTAGHNVYLVFFWGWTFRIKFIIIFDNFSLLPHHWFIGDCYWQFFGCLWSSNKNMTSDYKYFLNRAQNIFSVFKLFDFLRSLSTSFRVNIFLRGGTFTREINIKFRLFALVVCEQVNWPIAFHSLN